MDGAMFVWSERGVRGGAGCAHLTTTKPCLAAKQQQTDVARRLPRHGRRRAARAGQGQGRRQRDGLQTHVLGSWSGGADLRWKTPSTKTPFFPLQVIKKWGGL